MGLCSQQTDLWVAADFVPQNVALGTPQDVKGYTSTTPTCGPLLMLSPVVKRWGPQKKARLCSHHTHLWRHIDLVPRYEALGTSQTARVMWPPGPVAGHL